MNSLVRIDVDPAGESPQGWEASLHIEPPNPRTYCWPMAVGKSLAASDTERAVTFSVIQIFGHLQQWDTFALPRANGCYRLGSGPRALADGPLCRALLRAPRR
jgi:hypothetical protein